MIIDSHQHFWKYNANRHAWIDESMSVLKRNFMPNDLHPILSRHNIDGCIAIQADQSEDETNFLLNCAMKNKFIKGVVGWVDLKSEKLSNTLKNFTQNRLFKGVRHILQSEQVDFFQDKAFRRGIDTLTSYRLPYDLLVHHHQLPLAIDIVKQTSPKQIFVLNHIGKPNIDQTVCPVWENNINTLANYQNVYCKISGLVTETTEKEWEESKFTPFIEVVFKAFGSDRLLFGSDWPVCLLNGNYTSVLKTIVNYLANCPKELSNKVLGLNAINLYRIDI